MKTAEEVAQRVCKSVGENPCVCPEVAAALREFAADALDDAAKSALEAAAKLRARAKALREGR